MVVDRDELKRRIRERLGKAEEKPKEKPPREVSWKIIASLLVLALVIAGLAWFWFGGDRGGAQGAAVEENVLFEYRYTFSYLGPDNGPPLENLVLAFSAPQVENELAGTITGRWELWYIENDNTLSLQENSEAYITPFRGDRTESVKILVRVTDTTYYGPILLWMIDNLYPREVLVDHGWFWVSVDKADKVTLCVQGYNDASGDWNTDTENAVISYSFAGALWRENVKIEQFEWTQENSGPASHWLWPI